MNTKAFEECTLSERFIIEWQYNMLGGFKSALIDAISRADNDNLAKLSVGFPNEVEGFRKFSRDKNWWPDLQKRMDLP